MRTTLFILFFLVAAGSLGIAQTVTPEQRERILQRLQSSDYDTVYAAVGEAERHNVTEAIPILEARIWKQHPRIQRWFLWTLWKLGFSNTPTLARAFIDTVDSYAGKGLGIDPLSMKVDAVKILFDYGDYSGTPLVFELLERSKSIYPGSALLRKIVESVPEYSERARQEMMRLVREGETSLSRGYALRDLIQLYGLGVSDLMLYMARTDSVATNRWYAINMLISLGYPQIKPVLYDWLRNEPFSGYRGRIAETLLIRYGTPEDYRQVQLYRETETDTTEGYLVSRALQRFKPTVPAVSTPVLTLLDSLISIKHQVFALDWLADKNFEKELDNGLNNARNHLLRGDSTNTFKEVKKFQEKVQKEYEKTVDNEKKNKPRDKRFVTVEGWKFLYYNAQYILDRLPKKKGK